MVPPPCKKDGVDCADRHVGCQAECPKFKEFRAALDADARKRRMNAMCADYVNDQIFKDRRKLRYSADGRRALAQR